MKTFILTTAPGAWSVFFGPDNARLADLSRVPGLSFSYPSKYEALQAFKAEYKNPCATVCPKTGLILANLEAQQLGVSRENL